MIINNKNETPPPSYQNYTQYPSPGYHDNTLLPSYHDNTPDVPPPSYNEAIACHGANNIYVYQSPPQVGAVSNIQPVVTSRQPNTEVVHNQSNWTKKRMGWTFVVLTLVLAAMIWAGVILGIFFGLGIYRL